MDGIGLKSMGPITIEGTWDTFDAEPTQDGLLVGTIGDLRQLSSLPRKLKKRSQKWLTGRPMGRVERHKRIVVPFAVAR